MELFHCHKCNLYFDEPFMDTEELKDGYVVEKRVWARCPICYSSDIEREEVEVEEND